MPMMKAVAVHEFGEEDALSYEDVPIPEAGAGEVLIKVAAAAVNQSDLFIRRQGNSHIGPEDLPVIIGREVSGAVAALGVGVTDFRVGQRVVAIPGMGGYAEYTAARVSDVRPLPDAVDFVVGAAVPWVSLTAWFALTVGGHLKAGETVLIQSGGSGVGVAAIQFAKRLGTRVLTTTSTQEKCDRALALGAAAAINYVQSDFVAETLAATNGRGVDVVLETVGGDVYYKSLEVLAPGGRLVSIGRSGGPFPDPEPVPPPGTTAGRFSVSAHMEEHPESVAFLDEIFRWVAAGELKVFVDRVFPLPEAGLAHRYISDRRNFGKVILTL